jgi:hypothetical protein
VGDRVAHLVDRARPAVEGVAAPVTRGSAVEPQRSARLRVARPAGLARPARVARFAGRTDPAVDGLPARVDDDAARIAQLRAGLAEHHARVGAGVHHAAAAAAASTPAAASAAATAAASAAASTSAATAAAAAIGLHPGVRPAAAGARVDAGVPSGARATPAARTAARSTGPASRSAAPAASRAGVGAAARSAPGAAARSTSRSAARPGSAARAVHPLGGVGSPIAARAGRRSVGAATLRRQHRGADEHDPGGPESRRSASSHGRAPPSIPKCERSGRVRARTSRLE